ncbi:MAG: hypothetical protein U5J97_11985 [Trueperaceae bacterium]|nr:hypothetical protein [Trueperaceae bacterium]
MPIAFGSTSARPAATTCAASSQEAGTSSPSRRIIGMVMRSGASTYSWPNLVPSSIQVLFTSGLSPALTRSMRPVRASTVSAAPPGSSRLVVSVWSYSQLRPRKRLVESSSAPTGQMSVMLPLNGLGRPSSSVPM